MPCADGPAGQTETILLRALGNPVLVYTKAPSATRTKYLPSPAKAGRTRTVAASMQEQAKWSHEWPMTA